MVFIPPDRAHVLPFGILALFDHDRRVREVLSSPGSIVICELAPISVVLDEVSNAGRVILNPLGSKDSGAVFFVLDRLMNELGMTPAELELCASCAGLMDAPRNKRGGPRRASRIFSVEPDKIKVLTDSLFERRLSFPILGMFSMLGPGDIAKLGGEGRRFRNFWIRHIFSLEMPVPKWSTKRDLRPLTGSNEPLDIFEQGLQARLVDIHHVSSFVFSGLDIGSQTRV